LLTTEGYHIRAVATGKAGLEQLLPDELLGQLKTVLS